MCFRLVILILSIFITGWGRSNTTNQKMTNILQQIRLSVINQSKCSAWNSHLLPVTSQMFCAGVTQPKLKPHSACHGDSGGPLICKDADGSWTLNGLISWGSSICDTSDGYTVFTRVSKYVQWIVTKQLNQSSTTKNKVVITS